MSSYWQCKQPDGTRLALSEDLRRMVVEVPFCFALYEGKLEEKEFKGIHVGIVNDAEDIEAFLEGTPLAKLKTRIIVHNGEQV